MTKGREIIAEQLEGSKIIKLSFYENDHKVNNDVFYNFSNWKYTGVKKEKYGYSLLIDDIYISEHEFYQIQKNVNLNLILGIPDGSIETMFLEAQMLND